MASTTQPIPLPDDAMRAILSFLPFPELQQKALVNSQMSRAAIHRAKDIFQRAGTGGNYRRFAEWRHQTVDLAHTERRRAASASQLQNLQAKGRAQADQAAHFFARPACIRCLVSEILRHQLDQLSEAVARDKEVVEEIDGQMGVTMPGWRRSASELVSEDHGRGVSCRRARRRGRSSSDYCLHSASCGLAGFLH